MSTDDLIERIARTLDYLHDPWPGGIDASWEQGLRADGYRMDAAAVMDVVAPAIQAAKAEALREEADRISRLANEPQLIEFADRYEGFYAGVRAALQREVGSVRARATEYETGDQT